MSGSSNKKSGKSSRKVRVPFRRNRAKPPRVSDWTRRLRESEDSDLDDRRSESVVAKGDLSRKRTITIYEDGAASADLHAGMVIAMRGLYAEVDDGERIWTVTIRRVLRTRLIKERHPVIVGDRVHFRVEAGPEGVKRQGVIESVEPRKGQLRRKSGRRIHTIVANVDQVIIVGSAAEPSPKPHLIDRYIVAAHAGDITPVICMNKIDLDTDGRVVPLLELYAGLGYTTLRTSVITGDNIHELREALRDKSSVIVGQSGVGKSSLLNAVQPGLKLRVGNVIEQTQKGRHTTTTASLIRLLTGGYVVDTPGIRAFDSSLIPPHELEAHFVEIAPRVAQCKFPDCTHTHEIQCAIKAAVERGDIHIQRYETYLQMFEESSAGSHG